MARPPEVADVVVVANARSKVKTAETPAASVSNRRRE
jgi:hypothetical protein